MTRFKTNLKGWESYINKNLPKYKTQTHTDFLFVYFSKLYVGMCVCELDMKS